MADTHDAQPFTGYRFVIIEDEMMQAWQIGDMLAELGGTVARIAFNYQQGQDALTRDDLDCAIVDINLNGEPAFPLVKTLQQRGIPFVYCSAYIEQLVEIFPETASTIRVGKPVTVGKLRDAVLRALESRRRK